MTNNGRATAAWANLAEDTKTLKRACHSARWGICHALQLYSDIHKTILSRRVILNVTEKATATTATSSNNCLQLECLASELAPGVRPHTTRPEATTRCRGHFGDTNLWCGEDTIYFRYCFSTHPSYKVANPCSTSSEDDSKLLSCCFYPTYVRKVCQPAVAQPSGQSGKPEP